MGKPLLTDEIIERANRENTKRNVFNSKLNKILFAVILLLILLVLAMRFI